MALKSEDRPLDDMEALEEENIESIAACRPMHMQSIFTEYDYVGGDSSVMPFGNDVCCRYEDDGRKSWTDMCGINGLSSK